MTTAHPGSACFVTVGRRKRQWRPVPACRRATIRPWRGSNSYLWTSLPLPIVLRFQTFMRVIDALGGVTINVDQAVNDPTYPALVGNGYAPLVLKPGPQHMDFAGAFQAAAIAKSATWRRI